MSVQTAVAVELTGVQKVAVVLMQMDAEAASKVMALFTESEAEEIAAEIMKLHAVGPDTAEKVMDEFHAIAVKGRVHARGGRDIAAHLLEASFGAERAGNLMDRMDSTMAGKSFEFLDTAEAAQILGMLDGELAETIALVLAHLRPAVSSGIIGGLAEGPRTDVAQALATMGSATPEAISIVSDVLKVRAGAVVTPRETVDVVGGVQPLVDIINRSDIATEKALMASLDERDPELAAEVRARMLTFADIVKLEAKHIQQILRGIDVSVLAAAMKGATEQVLETIRKNVSERNRDILEAEIRNVGPLRMKVVEEARAEVVQAIRALEATGDISVRRSEDDDFVY